MPTSRNARGIDVLGHDHRGRGTITLQIKALSKSALVPFGNAGYLSNLIADYVVIARGGGRVTPEYLIARTEAVRPLVHTGLKDGKKSSCLQQKAYEQFKGRWETTGEGW